jgi:formylglycine-generating enzyme required for sulfatase activity
MNKTLDRLRSLILGATLVVLVTSCMAQFSPSPPPATPTGGPNSTPTTLPAAEQPGDTVNRSIAALADALNLDVAAISLVSMAREDFPDAALGCPQPGEVAAAVVTPGYRIILQGVAAQYEIHTNVDGTLIRCLPAGTPVVNLPDFTSEQATRTPLPTAASATPAMQAERTEIEQLKRALRSKDYQALQTAMVQDFWFGFYASDAGRISPDEAIEKLETTYLGPGLVRVYPQVGVDRLLPDWSSSAPYARLIYSTGWGQGQKDDAILLFEEQADVLHWAGIFYIFDGLKKTAYGERIGQLPPAPAESLKAVATAIESKTYDALQTLLADPVFFTFYDSDPSQLSREAFITGLREEYLEPGEVRVLLEVDVAQLLPGWTVEPPCDDLVYSTGWGEQQVDDGILCLRNTADNLQWAGLLYVYAPLKETAYAEPPPETDAQGAKIEGMVFVPPGPFIRGSSPAELSTAQSQCQQSSASCNIGQFEDEGPQHEITLKGYYIDETEVTVAAFKSFVAATGYKTTAEAKGDAIQYTWRAFDAPDRQDHPVRWMTWRDANAYCQWAGKRLPTEAEWEKAARGTDGRIYPWGNTWDDTRVPHGDTEPVTAHPNAASPYGALGMAGGVWEWVADWYDFYYYQSSPATDPTGPGQTSDKVLRGGGFANASWQHRAAHRHSGGIEGYAQDHGFRCARDVTTTPAP